MSILEIDHVQISDAVNEGVANDTKRIVVFDIKAVKSPSVRKIGNLTFDTCYDVTVGFVGNIVLDGIGERRIVVGEIMRKNREALRFTAWGYLMATGSSTSFSG